jgi:hypothetical protein
VRVVALEALEDSVMLDGAAKVRTPAGLASSPLPITVRDEEGFQFRSVPAFEPPEQPNLLVFNCC